MCIAGLRLVQTLMARGGLPRLVWLRLLLVKLDGGAPCENIRQLGNCGADVEGYIGNDLLLLCAVRLRSGENSIWRWTTEY